MLATLFDIIGLPVDRAECLEDGTKSRVLTKWLGYTKMRLISIKIKRKNAYNTKQKTTNRVL